MTAQPPRIVYPEIKQLVASNAAILRRLERIEALLLSISQRQADVEPRVPVARTMAKAPRVVGPVVHSVIARVALETGISVEDIQGDRKAAPICAARFRVYAEAHAAGASYAAIGRALGRDHTTVMAGAARYRSMQVQGGAQ